MTGETLKEKQARAGKCLRLLKKHYPDSRCSLNFSTVHELLVATILSAQCTDERVNQVTGALFAKYRSVEDFARADLRKLSRDVYPTGFHNNKARSIKKSAQQLLEAHGGRVPPTLDLMIKLAGVGRKTASVVLGAGFALAEGVVVDTHVGRLSRRLALTDHKHPARVEKDLMEIIPGKDWIACSYLFIDHGRAVCRARQPDCAGCFLSRLCPTVTPRSILPRCG